MEKGVLEPRPASPGPPIVPRSSRDGCKPIARRFQETVVPENQRILKAMGGKSMAFFVGGFFAGIGTAHTPESDHGIRRVKVKKMNGRGKKHV